MLLSGSLPQWILSLPRVGPYDAGSSAVRVQNHDSAWAAVSSSSSCCEALAQRLSNKVVTQNATNYEISTDSFFSLKNVDIHPSCIVLPRSAEDVSTAISTLTLGAKAWEGKCLFAVKGGGHTPFAEAATIEGGITIDINNLPSVGLEPDHKSITVSPSQKWDEAYQTLDAFDLSTLGARVAGVGVGGLTTGCGIAYYSARYGFTCDMVENFEAVLATGDIVNANAKENVDLWKPLRGGSNNFAVVAAITLRTFPRGVFWGGQTFHSIGNRKAFFQAHEDLIANYDPYVHYINTLVTNNMTGGTWIVGNSLQYTKSDPPVEYPNVFKPFTDIKQTPVFSGAPSNTLRVDNITSFSREYAALATYKKRWLFATISFGNSAKMMEIFFQMANETAQRFVHLPGFQLSISYQPLPTMMTERHEVDSLGPVQIEGNMFFIHWAMAVDGSEAHMDKPMQDATRKLFNATEEKTATMGLKRDYLAMTYSDSWQDPIGRRSEGTIRDMWVASKKYDPMQVFQKQVPGGFKLPAKV